MSNPHDPYADPNGQNAAPPVPPAPAGYPNAGAYPQQPAGGYPQQPAAGYPQQPAGAGYPQSTAAYPPVPPTGYVQPGPGLPKQPDNRPKTLALVALILAVVGFIAACIGFAPIGLPFVIVGGVLLLAAFVLSIVVLANRKQGGKGLGIAGLVVSVVGGIVFVFALLVSIAWAVWAGVGGGQALGERPAVSAPVAPSDEATDDQGNNTTATGDYDEAAYVAELRPTVRAIFKEIEPNATDDIIDSAYTDDTLVYLGTTLLTEYTTLGDDAIGQEASDAVDSSDGLFSEDQAERLMRAILEAAQHHLVEQ
ncbi:hypothetical protein [Microbacterium protaetiae]|uniref:hypothetical protein n=1 Tax=Microbacterium protaetiae TaxID=2509458 RepID=UPI001A91BE8E|nr:hypothetical protein [Microbacterium protaetiae]